MADVRKWRRIWQADRVEQHCARMAAEPAERARARYALRFRCAIVGGGADGLTGMADRIADSISVHP